MARVYNIGDTPIKNNRAIERSSLDAAYHFMPLSIIIGSNDVNLFKFPDLSSMANYLGIDESIDSEHVNKISKPISFDQPQLAKIKKAYAKDIDIYNNLYIM